MNNGEIWLIDLEPTIGAEIRKTRPAIIVSSNAIGILPLKIIVPITDWKPQYANIPWMIQLLPNEQNHLRKPSAADTFQVRSVAQERFVKQVGMLDEMTIKRIKIGLKRVLDIS